MTGMQQSRPQSQAGIEKTLVYPQTQDIICLVELWNLSSAGGVESAKFTLKHQHAFSIPVVSEFHREGGNNHQISKQQMQSTGNTTM